jgi:hypothetical protein
MGVVARIPAYTELLEWKYYCAATNRIGVSEAIIELT